MTVAELLGHLRRRSVSLWVEGDRLRNRASAHQNVLEPPHVESLAAQLGSSLARVQVAEEAGSR